MMMGMIFRLAVALGGFVLLFGLLYYAVALLIFARRLWAMPRAVKAVALLPAVVAAFEFGTLKTTPHATTTPHDLVPVFFMIATFVSLLLYIVAYRRRHLLLRAQGDIYARLFRPVATMFTFTVVAIVIAAIAISVK